MFRDGLSTAFVGGACAGGLLLQPGFGGVQQDADGGGLRFSTVRSCGAHAVGQRDQLVYGAGLAGRFGFGGPLFQILPVLLQLPAAQHVLGDAHTAESLQVGLPFGQLGPAHALRVPLGDPAGRCASRWRPAFRARLRDFLVVGVRISDIIRS